LTEDGEGSLAIGTPGGDQQDQWPLTVLLRHRLDGHGLHRAIDAPMFHRKHWPGSFYPREYELGRLLIEDRYDASVLDALRERGHKLSVLDSWSLGRVCAVQKKNGLLYGAATPRHAQSYAIVRCGSSLQLPKELRR